jgi:hypothetical protein
MVAEHMVHGPCGKHNPKSLCMKNGRCSKNYPKEFYEKITVDENGFAVYKRPKNKRFVIKAGIKLYNHWIVPHNLELLKKYDVHINAEWCNKSIFIKYLFKYVTKSPDCSKAYLQKITNGEDTPIDEETNTRNEVQEYLDTRYMCSFDSCWRVFGFEIHRHLPAVKRMPVHLPDEIYITYNAHVDMSEILSQEFLCKTMPTEWFVANQKYPDAKNLYYCDFPSKWHLNEQARAWGKRRRDGSKIGRIYFVHLSVGERYYLRMLLLTIKGPESYESLCSYNNAIYATFKEMCNAHGLLSDDQEWYNAFDKAAHWATSNQLRQLFVAMLLFCEVGDEHMFFEKVWRLLADDIQYNMRQILNHPTYDMSDGDLQDHLLDTLGTLFNRRGTNINDFKLPR